MKCGLGGVQVLLKVSYNNTGFVTVWKLIHTRIASGKYWEIGVYSKPEVNWVLSALWWE